MKFTKITLATTTALTLSMTAAFANENEAYLLQQGNNHSATIDQSEGSGNDAGRDNGVITQRSESTQLGNTLSIKQSGDANAVGTGTIQGRGTGVFQLNQSGPGSTATIVQDSTLGTAGNEIGTINQVATQTRAGINTLSVTQNGGGNNEVTDISQYGNGSTDGTTAGRLPHTATITQTGNDNLISILRQGGRFDPSAGNEATIAITGNSNGRGNLSGLADVGVADSAAIQSGTSNDLEFSITGGSSNQFGFSQTGSGNQAVGLSISGDNNELGVIQNGDRNEVTLASITGSDNVIGFTQLGGDNSANGSILNDGNNNSFGISQNGNFNSASVSLDGDDNGATSTGLFGVAATLGLTNGLVAQWGDTNEASLTVVGSNNAFAFEQGSSMANGSGNSITGNVNGSNNAVAVAQLSNSNMATFTQNGSGNSAAMSQ